MKHKDAMTSVGDTTTTQQTAPGARYRPRGHVVAVQYPVEQDAVREVEIRGLARQLGMVAHEPFNYGRRGNDPYRPADRIFLKRGQTTVITVPRGHWFVVHPRPGSPLFEVLSDQAFRETFDGPDHSAESAHDLAAAVAAEARYHLGNQVELRILNANHYITGHWAHPAMQAVITGIRAQLTERDAELWEPVDEEDLARWDRNRTALPVAVQVRPQLGRHGDYHPGSARHAIPGTAVRGERQYAAGLALCETTARATPLPLGPVTIAPPSCSRCLTHLRSIAERHGHVFEQPPATPPTPVDDSDKIGAETPTVTADMPHLGEGWRLVQYEDPDRWWLHQDDRIRGYIHRYTNTSGNKTGWQAFTFAGHSRYRHLDATSAASHRPRSSFLWRSVALAAWGIATRPAHGAANPDWTRNWRVPRTGS